VRLPVLFLFIAIATLATSAEAQSDQERTALARSLFEEGVRLGEQGRWQEAADRYRRVLVIRATVQVKYNLALALSNTGAVVEPVELSRQVLRDANAPAAAQNDARALLERLEPRVARLTIRLDGDSRGAEITLDDEPVDAVGIGVAMPVDPGAHEVQARRGAEVVASERVEVAEGARAEVTLDVPAPAEPVAPSPAETASASVSAAAGTVPMRGPDQDRVDDGGGAWWPWALLGVVLVAGAVVGVVLLTRSDEEELAGNLTPGRIEFE
jgi:hypothetical protein